MKKHVNKKKKVDHDKNDNQNKAHIHNKNKDNNNIKKLKQKEYTTRSKRPLKKPSEYNKQNRDDKSTYRSHTSSNATSPDRKSYLVSHTRPAYL